MRFPDTPRSIIPLFLLILSAVVSFSDGAAAQEQLDEPPPLKDDMRLLWQPHQAEFLRHWLLCGEFPNPNASGLEKDYLKEVGGEAAVQPTIGMTVRRPDGTTATWADHKPEGDIINLLKAFPGRPTINVVAYGYTVVDWPKNERALLSVGSDDGVKVWLNGKVVLDHLIPRGVRKDEDQVEVPLQAGPNKLLVKVEQGAGDWGFCVRFLSPAMLLLLPPRPVGFQLFGDFARPHDLIIRLGATAAMAGFAESPAAVDVTGAGGVVVASQKTVTGQDVRLDTEAWENGAYDIRVSAVLPNGRKSIAYGIWYKGDALAAAKKLVATAPFADHETQPGMVHAMLADLVIDRLGKDLNKVDPAKVPSVYSALMEYDELQMDGGYGGRRPNGFVRLAYRDPVDNSPQFCRAYLPPDYSPDKKWPMVVHLHGYNPPNPPYVQWGIDGRHHGWADNYGVIALEPLGRYNTTFWGIGEQDVIRSIQMAKQQLSVDDDRVYLVGESMGGGGAWYVGSRHPELFAAISPEFGGRDYHADLTDEEADALSAHDLYRAEARSMFVQTESLLTTPVFVNHGDLDDLVKVDYSRYAVRMLQRWGYNVRYWEHPNYGHGGFNVDDELFPWLLQQRRVADPKHVRLRAADISTAAAHWVRVEQPLDPWQLVNVDAEITSPNIIRLDTQNVACITLSPGKAIIDPSRPVEVVWNGDDLRTVSLTGGSVTLNVEGYTDPPLPKTPRRFGRMDDVFRTPFAIVVGTQSSDPTMNRYIQRTANQLVSWWRQWQHVVPRLFTDTTISDTDAARYSLVLLGGPAENAISRRFAGNIPLKVFPEGFEIDGKQIPAKDAVAQVVYPHPQNPDRYLAVLAPNSPAGMYFSDRLAGDLDFAILDSRLPNPDEGRPASAVRICGGMFDNGWREDDSFVETADEDVRDTCPTRNLPSLLSTTVHASSLMLGDVVENASEGTFATMMRNQNWNGGPITLAGVTYSHGIAVQVAQEPCSASWDISGVGWKHLRATVGIEVDPAMMGQREKDNTLVQFIVQGDGRELYKSPMLRWDSPPIPIDVEIQDVGVLKLIAAQGSTYHNAAQSVDWADVRLER